MQNLNSFTNKISDPGDGLVLNQALRGVYDRIGNVLLSTGGLAIKANGGVLVKVATACTAVVNGTIVQIAAATDCAALSGTITASYYNVFCFYVDASGTLTTLMGREAAALSGVKFPPVQERKALLGFVILQAASGHVFTGNDATYGVLDSSSGLTTASTTYVNTPGCSFDTTASI